MPNKKAPPNWYTAGKHHIWHPYTQHQTAPDALAVRSLSGSTITLETGETLIDGIANWWSACHGHQHPHIIGAMEAQLKTFPHVMFAGLAHEPAYLLATTLAQLTGLERVFFSDSGSVAIEVAMKMAVQYWRQKGSLSKTRFLSFCNGYHGDTMGAMSLADPNDSMHKAFTHYMPMQYVVDIPSDEYGFADFEALLQDAKKNLAAVVIEPLVQGAGGMKFHTADILAEIRKLCAKHEVLFIADEIFTGFGRTGTMFACREAGITPDILCLGKALTGGAVSLAATLAGQEIFEAFLSPQFEHAFMHGPTFMANPLACAAANASIELFEKETRLAQVAAIEEQLREELEPLRHYPNVADIRVMGAIGVVELQKTDRGLILDLRQKLLKEGVWLRPFGNTIYLTPAFTISKPELTTLTQAICRVLKA